jgi:hypothetical protein
MAFGGDGHLDWPQAGGGELRLSRLGAGIRGM